MRDIKFRGFTINEEKYGNGKDGWIYGNLLLLENKKAQIQDINDDNFFKFIDIKSLGQYTGSKDKNRKEIYEGDVVKVFTNKEWRIGIIIYEHSGFTIDVTNNKELEYGRTSIIENLTEVIGNIYDNPELLEKGE